jgi:hypothetical protein
MSYAYKQKGTKDIALMVQLNSIVVATWRRTDGPQKISCAAPMAIPGPSSQYPAKRGEPSGLAACLKYGAFGGFSSKQIGAQNHFASAVARLQHNFWLNR